MRNQARPTVMPTLYLFLLLTLSACEVTTGADSYSLNSSPTDYQSIARQEAMQAGIDPNLFERQINQESGFNPKALSPAGAQGIAQFEPATALGLGINPWNPSDALRGAARLMAAYVAKYGDYAHALAAYNCGTGCLNRAMQNCSYYYWCLPTETERYIHNIMM